MKSSFGSERGYAGIYGPEALAGFGLNQATTIKNGRVSATVQTEARLGRFSNNGRLPSGSRS
jgi:hypothetical protein